MLPLSVCSLSYQPSTPRSYTLSLHDALPISLAKKAAKRLFRGQSLHQNHPEAWHPAISQVKLPQTIYAASSSEDGCRTINKDSPFYVERFSKPNFPEPHVSSGAYGSRADRPRGAFL